jgi:HK97 family phage prohead protease
VKDVDAKTGEFSGYASVFDVVDWYGDVVVPGAFTSTLEAWAKKSKLPSMLWQHRAAEPIGVWTKMAEDAKGLYAEGRILLDAGDLEKRAHAHLKAGSISGLSIGFDIAPGGLAYDSNQGAWLLKQVDLWEVSLVTFPANEEAQVDAVKTALAAGPKEFERFLREAGLTRSQAKGLMARGYEGLGDLREADELGLDAVRAVLQSNIKTLTR